MISVSVPGRVNLIGDHTDYTGGLVLPMPLDQYTTITGITTDEPMWHLRSADEDLSVTIALPVIDPTVIEPRWGCYVAGVLSELHALGHPVSGFRGTVTTTLPIGAGLSSSAALEIAVARIALSGTSHNLSETDLALLCQRAEHIASGVPCGIMDQLCIASGKPGSATLIDCHALSVSHIAIPEDLEVIVQFISQRTLLGSEYADRVADCREVEMLIGPLRLATESDLRQINNPRLHRRARHVISENQRVRDFAQAIIAMDYVSAGELMQQSHWSLARDYETCLLYTSDAADDIL
jgi:galactokinase